MLSTAPARKARLSESLGDRQFPGDRIHMVGIAGPADPAKRTLPLGVSTGAYVGREHKQQRPADPTCRAIGHFGGGPAAPKLQIEPPDQHACRNEFDQAIRAERD
jgi:hypothetical protein